MNGLIDQKCAMQANITAFTTHRAYIEMCGMLYNEEISRPNFDTFLRMGMAEAVGGCYNANARLGVQAGANLMQRLERIRGLAILEKRPMAKYERGGTWGEMKIPPHPSYALLKRAKLTSEFDPPE